MINDSRISDLIQRIERIEKEIDGYNAIYFDNLTITGPLRREVGNLVLQKLAFLRDSNFLDYIPKAQKLCLEYMGMSEVDFVAHFEERIISTLEDKVTSLTKLLKQANYSDFEWRVEYLSADDLRMSDLSEEIVTRFKHEYRKYVLIKTTQLYRNFLKRPQSPQTPMTHFEMGTLFTTTLSFVGLTLFYQFTRAELNLDQSDQATLKNHLGLVNLFIQDYTVLLGREGMEINSREWHNYSTSQEYSQLFDQHKNELNELLELS